MDKVDLIERKGPLQNNEKLKSNKSIPLALTYSTTLPNTNHTFYKLALNYVTCLLIKQQ